MKDPQSDIPPEPSPESPVPDPVTPEPDKHTPPQADESREPEETNPEKLPEYEFEFEILDANRQVVATERPRVPGVSEDAAMSNAVSALKVAEGQSYRYTGKFTKHEAI